MPLFAILSDDKLSVREIKDIPDGTQFKLGYVFPVVVDPMPAFDPKVSFVTQVPQLPVKDVVHVAWVIQDLPPEKAAAIVESDALSTTFDQLQAIKEKIDGAGGKLEAADQTALLTYTLETLLRLRDPLMQIQKRLS